MTTTENDKSKHNQQQPFEISVDKQGSSKCFESFDDDGRPKRTGTMWTASAHIITAVIGSGVLSLAWAIAQLGWIAGVVMMVLFSIVTYYTSILLTICYRNGDQVTGKRNYTYMEAVRSHLGGFKVQFCGWVQYVNLFGVAVGYTIAAAISMMAVKRSNCFHDSGGKNPCHMNSNVYMIVFGVVQMIFCQIPDFHELWWLSTLASAMSFVYSIIGLSLGAAKVIENKTIKGTITGVAVGSAVTQSQKIWRCFQALGNIAFAYSYSMILIEIEDTLKSPPAESKTMKKATFVSVSVTSIFYMLCGFLGYAAFGDESPGNLLTGFGFYEPYWLLDIANVAVVIHLVGSYQVYCIPLFTLIETYTSNTFPNSSFVNKDMEVPIPGGSSFKINFFRLVWRTCFVIMTTILSMLLPFFNDIVGLIGALGFWPLTVYLPVEMYIVVKRIPKWSTTWIWLNILSFVCLLITIIAAAGSINGIADDLKTYKPFVTNY